MPQQTKTSVENNFTGGLKTEYTGLNFPENACIDADNTVFTITGDVIRRLGIDFEDNFSQQALDRTGKAVTYYRWDNAGGDGNSQILVLQVGSSLKFYRIDTASPAQPLSTQLIPFTVDLTQFVTTNGPNPSTFECQYSDGNGCLFVFNPSCDPFVCTYVGGQLAPVQISVQIRDFSGMPEPGVAVNARTSNPTIEHIYNLGNQGWTSQPPWFAVSGSSIAVGIGSKVFTVPSGMTVTVGDIANIALGGPAPPLVTGQILMAGVVTAYSGTNLTINVTSDLGAAEGLSFANWLINSSTHGQTSTWFSALGVYPSNSDVWWTYKDSTDVFNPSVTASQITINTGYAPRGHFILNAFDQQRSLVSGQAGLTSSSTTQRPSTGTWFAGRLFMSGVNASQGATGDAGYISWSEDIYFSQIVTDPSQYGMCYQVNDPTSETLFDLLPTDGGVIKIQGSGGFVKLFPVTNGLLAFGRKGIWFITGKQGIGFTADDYTITKISSIHSISGNSYVNVMGYPMFWNEEGIYSITVAQTGIGLNVDPITVGTILSYYTEIPTESKRFARGDYDPLNYTITWCYRSTDGTDLTSKYEFDKMLNYNMANKAFYPYSVQGPPHIHGVAYVSGPGTAGLSEPTFKYIVSTKVPLPSGNYQFTFGEERDDENYVDWISNDGVGVNYSSTFTTGYKLHGGAQRQFQAGYVYVYSKQDTPTAYKIQGIWDYAIDPNSGKYSTPLIVNNNKQYFGHVFRRHRIRGLGTVLQFKVSSIDGKPFDIVGWSIWENQNDSI